MEKDKALETLKAADRRVSLLRDSIAVLSFDMETVMPEKAAEERGEQIALLSGLQHEFSLSDETCSAVECLKDDEELSLEDRALVRSWNRFLSIEGKLPKSFVEESARLTSLSQSAWVKARENDDFASYAPLLAEVFLNAEEKARIINPEADAYDTLLDLYEEGMNASFLASVFDPLETSIHEIMDMCCGRRVESGFLYVPYDRDRLHAFCMKIIIRMGFDFSRGLVSISAHPFTSYLGRDDIRMTTRYSDPSYFDSVSTIVHECGHALYDMNASLNEKIRGSGVGFGSSMSLHESQSRFWENMILRRRSFWLYAYPMLQEAVDGLQSVSLDDFYRAINRCTPSAIRVNADEVTYPLHIILRFRLEKMLMGGSLAVKDLPEAWNEMSSKIIRYDVKSDSEGCLQDVHWAEGLIGYFPSYAMGSIAAACFMKTLEERTGGKTALDERISRGEWNVVTDFQREEIWQYGSLYDFGTVVRRVTGHPLDADVYKAYLADKYKEIYNS